MHLLGTSCAPTPSIVPLAKNSASCFPGGMLVQALDVQDLQFAKLSPFDGTMAYAQNKRQQVVMTEKWAEKYKDVYFASMHPGEFPGYEMEQLMSLNINNYNATQ